MKTALVTGSAGFLGRHLVPKLESAGYKVTGVDPLAPWYDLSPCCSDKSCGSTHPKYILGFTFEDWLRCGKEKKFDVVVHLAAHIPDISERLKGGLHQFQDIQLDWAVANYVKEHPPREAFIVPSSCAIDSWEMDPYAFCKLTAERFWTELHKAGVPTVILKPFSGYGPDQADSYPFAAILKRALSHADPLTVWGRGDQVRDWIHVDDLTDAFLWAIKKAPHGTPIDIGTGVGTDMIELAQMIAMSVYDKGRMPTIESDPSKPTSSMRRVADTTLACAHGFEAKISLEEGIRRAVESLNAETPRQNG